MHHVPAAVAAAKALLLCSGTAALSCLRLSMTITWSGDLHVLRAAVSLWVAEAVRGSCREVADKRKAQRTKEQRWQEQSPEVVLEQLGFARSRQHQQVGLHSLPC